MAAVALSLGFCLVPASAQDAGTDRDGSGRAERPAAKPPSDAAAPKKAEKPDGDGASSRMARLEDQMVDIQVALGTLQSLVRNNAGGGGTPMPRSESPLISGAGDGDMAARLQALETQIGALTAQIEQINRQMGQGGTPAGSEAPPPREDDGGWQPLQQNHRPPPAATPSDESASRPPWQADQNDAGDPRDLGSQRLEPLPQSGSAPRTDDERVRVSRLGRGAQAAMAGDVPFAVGESAYAIRETAPSNAAVAADDARTLYDQAYGDFRRKDYASAEGGFRQLLDSYPKDPIAAEAQYWLGETYYARGAYRDSADAFLKGYRDRPRGRKAGASLLRLGQSLARLGQREAACASFGEVTTTFPDSADLNARAQAERTRAAC